MNIKSFCMGAAVTCLTTAVIAASFPGPGGPGGGGGGGPGGGGPGGPSSPGPGSPSGASSALSFGPSSPGGHGPRRLAAGAYRLVGIEAFEGQLDMVRIKLRPVVAEAESTDFELAILNDAVSRKHLASGDMIHVRRRFFGEELLHGQDTQPFHIVLLAEALRDLDTLRIDR